MPRQGRWATAILLSASLLVPALADSTAVAEQPAKPQAVTELPAGPLAVIKPSTRAVPVSEGLEQLARAGRFMDLLDQLRARPDTAQRAADLGLIEHLERFQRNENDRARQRTDAFNSAIARAKEELSKQNLEDAVIAVIEAHSLAADQPTFLADAFVDDVVKRTERAARDAELARDWFEASTLYSRLNLLYEHDRKYQRDVERVGKHLRVLSLYNPQKLRDMLTQRDERLGKPAPQELAQTEPDDWHRRVMGLSPDILRKAVERAAISHIEHRGYERLIRGAVEAMMVLVDTDGVVAAFPTLSDEEPRAQFWQELLTLRNELDKVSEPLTRFAAMGKLDQVFAANQRTVNLPESVLVYEMTEGALSALDEFTSMYWPDDVDQLRRSTQGSFVGVGIQIYRRDGQLTVVSPLPSTPAQRAGIRAGDIIATVNTLDTSSWSLDRAVREITGPEGSQVTLGIRRAGEKDPLDLSITRQRIDIESVKGWSHTADGAWDYWLDRKGGVGYVRVTQFIPQTVDKMNEAVDAMRSQGPLNGLVLDLRFNPGGLLPSAIAMVNRFQSEGAILYTVDSTGQRKDEWLAERRGSITDLPIVILINKGSASASEIVSGALQDHDRAYIVGTRSYGKGSVQNVFWFPSDRNPHWGLKVTTEHYQLPNGSIIHRTDKSTQWGIEPDLLIAPSDDLVAWGIEVRQEVDVLRDPAEPVRLRKSNPAVKLAGLVPLAPRDNDANDLVEVPNITPASILELGLDPQLDAAVLVLKTQALAKATALAEAPAPGTNNNILPTK